MSGQGQSSANTMSGFRTARRRRWGVQCHNWTPATINGKHSAGLKRNSSWLMNCQSHWMTMKCQRCLIWKYWRKPKKQWNNGSGKHIIRSSIFKLCSNIECRTHLLKKLGPMLTSLLVTHIPHSSTEVPLDIRDQFILNDDELDLEIKITDHQTKEIFTTAFVEAMLYCLQSADW